MPRYDNLAEELTVTIERFEGRLQQLCRRMPSLPSARICERTIERALQRIASLRTRLTRPLVVATLGGTGTGKSSLINALVGEPLLRTGRIRPTTTRPVLISRSDMPPQRLGLDAGLVEWKAFDSPATEHVAFIDCPDPDTTDQPEQADTNLARLRAVLPFCDVIIVTATQEKYRSARVKQELIAAATGAHFLFVQTHGDRDADIRSDWRKVLEADFQPGEIFLVDSVRALEDQKQGKRPSEGFARLQQVLYHEIFPTAVSVRAQNFFDIVSDTLDRCTRLLQEDTAAVNAVLDAVERQRLALVESALRRIEPDLLAYRRQWERLLLQRVVSQWMAGPFGFALQIYCRLDSLIAGSLLLRARSVVQLAVIGAVHGAQKLRGARSKRRSEQLLSAVEQECWDRDQLRRCCEVVGGYLFDAQLNPDLVQESLIEREAAQAAHHFAERLGQQIDEVVQKVGRRATRWYVQVVFEVLFLAMLVAVIGRLALNFFGGLWSRQPYYRLLGLDWYLIAVLWIAIWAALLIWLLTGSLRKRLRKQMRTVVQRLSTADAAKPLFAAVEQECDKFMHLIEDIRRLREQLLQTAKRFPAEPGVLAHKKTE